MGGDGLLFVLWQMGYGLGAVFPSGMCFALCATSLVVGCSCCSGESPLRTAKYSQHLVPKRKCSFFSIMDNFEPSRNHLISLIHKLAS